ncbi:MAG TPA: hypothetical protein VES42_10850, partial [Pilimelia sp.]|nr:hypothetical protein [Pilimelia sp.]
LGPIAGAAVLAGGRAILAGQLTAGAPESSQLNGVHHLGTSAAVLMVGAAVVGGIAVAEALLPRIAAARAK